MSKDTRDFFCDTLGKPHVTAGSLSGIAAGNAVMTSGLSRGRLEDFFANDPYSREIRNDLRYAQAARKASAWGKNLGFLDGVLSLAREDQRVRTALFNSVSAHKPFREIARETVTLSLAARVLGIAVRSLASRIRESVAGVPR